MFYVVLVTHIFLCLVLVTLVLLQQGKGASVGAVFGGSSNTLFGATGANTVLTKVTTGLAVAFMLTSVMLVRMYPTHAAASRTGVSNDPMQGSVVAAPVEAVPEQGTNVAKDAAPVEASSSATTSSVPLPPAEKVAETVGSSPVAAAGTQDSGARNPVAENAAPEKVAPQKGDAANKKGKK